MIFLILLLGLTLRLVNLNQSLWLDEAINTLAVKNYTLVDLVTQYIKADFHPPGWFIFLWFWTKFFGYSEISVRIPSVIFGVLTVWIIYLIGKKLISKEIGIIAALLLAVNPLHIYYSQEARMYVMATFAVSINVFLFIKLVKGEKIYLAVLTLCNLFVLISDYIAYFIFPAQFMFLLLYKKKLLKKWLIGLFSALFLGVWWLPTFLSQLKVGAAASGNLPAWKLINGAFDFKTLPLTFVKFIIGRISLTDKLLYTAVLLPVCSLYIFLLWRGIKSINSFLQKLLIILITLPLIIATAVSFVVPVYNYFRVLFVLPFFLILLSFGITSMKKLRYTFLVLVFSVELFCTLIYLLNPVYHREDWKGLVDFLINKPAVVLFESSGVLPPFDYYAKKQLTAQGALKDFPAKDDNSIADLRSLLNNSQEVYLVDYLVEISDPNRLVARRLVKLGYKQSDINNFTGVGFIYHYVKE